MPENLLTKCPHCSTTFRLTQAQLDIAGGAVRCGACYQVFHAAEHIIKTSVVEEHRHINKKPDPIEEAFEMDSEEGLDPYDSDDLEIQADADDLFSEDYRASLDKESGLSEFGYEDEKPRKKGNIDESWAEELLKELGDDDEELIGESEDDHASPIISSDSAFGFEDDSLASPLHKKKSDKVELSDTFMNLGHFSGDDPFAISDIEEEESVFSGNESIDESWAKAILDELENEDKPKPTRNALAIEVEKEEIDDSPFAAKNLSKNKTEMTQRAKQELQKRKALNKQHTPKPSKPVEEDDIEPFFNLLDEEDDNEEAFETTSLIDENTDLEEIEDFAPEKLFADSDEVINQQIRLSALEYADEEKRSQPALTALLSVGCLVLLITLAAQYAYFNFNSVSRIPEARPWLERACKYLDCTLPSQSDVSQIAGTNLVVRSHPFEKEALVIDVIIKNRASFNQPYPVVQLNFEDLNGNAIASRRFKPEEYILDGNINLQNMPSNVPIHLTLEIVDPGQEAVNYQMLFLSPDANG